MADYSGDGSPRLSWRKALYLMLLIIRYKDEQNEFQVHDQLSGVTKVSENCARSL